jgi:hypothetical protein
MADIDVVKKSSHTWLWIVIAIAIVLALWFMMAGGSNEPRVGSMIDGGQPLAAALAASPQAPPIA